MSTLRNTLLSTAVFIGAGHPALAAPDPYLVDPDLPTVLSATRLRQSPAEVPGSMTVLDRALIRASGARDIPELLRLVPGMKVGYQLGHRGSVNYHGTNTTEARRLQVLVDGRSVYRPGLATVDWTDIPLAIEDIERIEVFRGPNTAAYGANALMGVINIISIAPELYQGTRVKVTRGNRGVQDTYASQGFAGDSTQARLSLMTRKDTGFDHNLAGDDFRDSRRSSAFTLAGTTGLSDDQSLLWQLGAKEGSNQRAYDYSALAPGTNPAFTFDRIMTEHRPTSDTKAADYFAQLQWSYDISPRQQLEIRAYAQHMERLKEWRACDSPVVFSPELRQIYEADPLFARRVNNVIRGRGANLRQVRALVGDDLMPLVESVLAEHAANRDNPPVCWDINENMRETRYDFELQHTAQIADNLRAVAGGGLRHDHVSSRTYFGGDVDNYVVQLFSNLEYRPHQRWLLHAGLMAEDDRLSGFSLSPRLAAQYFMQPTQSLRLVYSEAVRSPDMYENNASWTYPARNVSGPERQTDAYYALARGPENLRQEEMKSWEVGYNGYFHQAGLTLDVKAFYDEISNMISEPLQVINFEPSNENFSRFTGVETQLDWRIGRADRLRLTYAYIDFVATRSQDQRLTARNSGSAAWIRQWPGAVESSFIYYGADMLNQRRFERLDGRLAKSFGLGRRSEVELAMTWQYRLDDEGLTWPNNLYDSPSHYYLSAQVNF